MACIEIPSAVAAGCRKGYAGNKVIGVGPVECEIHSESVVQELEFQSSLERASLLWKQVRIVERSADAL